MSREMAGAEMARLAVLSYHSWDMSPEMLTADIRGLRDDGWRFVSANEAARFVAGAHAGNDSRLALVTTDDGHPEDVEFRDVLRREGCPGVTFVTVGRMTPERLAWCKATHSEDWSVQDHTPLHRRQFVSGHLTGVYHGQKIGGLEYLDLPLGAPLLVSGGQLSAPRFDPHPDAMALAAEWARSEDPVTIASTAWVSELATRLGKERLAYRWRGRVHVVGTLESEEQFEQRVRQEVVEGRAMFERALGRKPEMFAYPWWQGSVAADREFALAGYEMTFAGIGRVQGPGMPRYSIPRIVMDPPTPRPVNLSVIEERARHDWTRMRGRVERAAKRLMGVA